MAQSIEVKNSSLSLLILPADLGRGGVDSMQSDNASRAGNLGGLGIQISGAFFFGAAANVGKVLGEISQYPQFFVIDI